MMRLPEYIMFLLFTTGALTHVIGHKRSQNLNQATLHTISTEIPDDFDIKVSEKDQGKLFLDNYQVWQAFIDCAAQAALQPFTGEIPTLECEEPDATVGFAFIGNKPPQPVFETRHILWTLFYLYSWPITGSSMERNKWQELYAFTFIGPAKLGLTRMYATHRLVSATSNTTSEDQSLSMDSASQIVHNESSVTANDTAGVQSIRIQSQGTISQAGTLDVKIKIDPTSEPLCKDIQFFKAILMTIVALGARDALDAIEIGVAKYFVDGNFTFSIQATSEEAGAQKLLRVWLALRALRILAYKMSNTDRNLRFKPLEGRIIQGTEGTRRTGTRIIGKIMFLGGDRIDRSNGQVQDTGLTVLDGTKIEAVY